MDPVKTVNSNRIPEVKARNKATYLERVSSKLKDLTKRRYHSTSRNHFNQLAKPKLGQIPNPKSNRTTQCGGKNLGPDIRIPGPPIQLEDSINVSPVTKSGAPTGDEFRRGTQNPTESTPVPFSFV